MTRDAVAGLLLVFVSMGAARGQESAWAGTWRDEATGEARSVVREGAEAVLSVTIGEAVVSCRGHTLGSALALEGRLPRTPGLAGALEGRDADGGPTAVRVDGLPDAEGEHGEERAVVRLRLGRRVVREERWTRPGVARLELLRTEGIGRDGLDPIERGLTVHVRVLGRAQDVSLVVELLRGDRGERPSFYRQAGARGRVVREVRAGVLEPGEHALEWDGRDGTWAARIALQGAYGVRVDSPERRADAGRARGQAQPVTLDVTVARPRAMVHAPVLRGYRSTPETTGKLTGDLLQEYAVERTTASETADRFMRRLPTMAVSYVDTHGEAGAFLVGDGESIQAADVQNAMRAGDRKPLRDVHAVFVAACDVALPRVLRGPDGAPVAQVDLTAWLLNAGVDVVVAFRSPVVAVDVEAYHGLLGPRLLEYGAPIERATHDAARQAAEQVHYRWQEFLTAWNADHFWQAIERLRPVKDALIVRAGVGIDPAAEALMPARYGVSTN